MAHGLPLKITVMSDAALKKQGLNLIYNVGKASTNKPRFLIMEYTGSSPHKTICLCGKGVTFDAGGTQAKTGKANSYQMKGDKTGGCIVIGMMLYFASVGIPCKLVGLVPLADNITSADVMKPGDIIKSYNGKTIEILDTDAEGRLLLADSMAYAARYDPNYVFDFATLTGWASKLHCGTSAIFYSHERKLHQLIEKVGEETGERTWGMPRWLDYMKYCKSDVADLKNSDFTIERCSEGSGFMAAMFLAHFVPPKCLKNGWVHFDITNNVIDHLMSANTMNLGIGLIKRLVYNK